MIMSKPPHDETRVHRVGQILSHYRIVERLGAGGMGEVYKADDLLLHRSVALKVLLTGLHADVEARQRLLREAQAASSLSHPNIATIYEADEFVEFNTPQLFIVMEYVSGMTAGALAAQKELSLAEVLEIVLQIADALAEAHQQGIIHRDIKPSNVLVTSKMRVKVVDFGLAKFRDAQVALDSAVPANTMPGTVMGTVSYMSPEQALGREVDHRSDIFSLGVLAYELLTGKLPFTGPSSIAVIDGILHKQPPSPSQFNPRLNIDVERVIRRMMEKERERRYQSMREVWTDLDGLRRRISGKHQLPPEWGDSAASSSTQVLLEPVPDSAAFPAVNRSATSLAVMSFVNITKNEADDWIGSGIAETVTADLKTIDGVTVIGRERLCEVIRSLYGEDCQVLDESVAARVGREVGARWLISGGYQRIGEMLRITARFVEVETGVVMHTVKIDGRMAEIFDLQDRIVFELSQQLQVDLRTTERKGIRQEETGVIEAYEACTKGMINLRIGSPGSLDRAIELLEQAVELDPQYARAWIGLGTALELKAHFLSQPEHFERAIASYQRAIELRPMIPDSYRGLGIVFLYQGRVEEAIGAIRRSLAMAPEDFGAHAALGRAYFLGKVLFREAAEEFEKALSLNPKAGWIALQLAYCYALLGQYDAAERTAKSAVTLQEQYLSGKEGMQIIGAYARLGYVYHLQGRYLEAVELYLKELDFLRNSSHALKDRAAIETYQRLGASYLALGRAQEAQEALGEALEGYQLRISQGIDDPFTRYYIAAVHVLQGRTEQALDELEQAAKANLAYTIKRARQDPDFLPLGEHPRFRELVQQSEKNLPNIRT